MEIQYRGRTRADIAASVEAAVRTGRLGPGDPLPPVRRLAADLRVSPATVAAAYRDLKQRAVVETDGRAGTRVRTRPALGARRARLPAVPPGTRDLSTGGPDSRLLPALGPALGRLAAAPDLPTGYDQAGLLPEFARAAHGRLAADGIPVGEGTLTATNGALDAIERVLTAQLEPGDRVGVEDPGWANLLDLLTALRLEPVPVPVDDEGPTAAGFRDALRSGVRAVVVTSRAQNPTGAAVSADRAAALRDVLADHAGVLVVEDDHAAELSELPLASLAGATAAWAFVRSVSKPYGPDLRVALLAGDDVTVGRVAGRQAFGAGWVSTVLQRLVLDLWQDPAVTDLVDRARRSYAGRREGLRRALAARGVHCVGRSGINVWVPVPDETAAVTALRDAGWAVAPGAANRLRSDSAIRITVSALDADDLDPLADAVAAALSQGSTTHTR